MDFLLSKRFRLLRHVLLILGVTLGLLFFQLYKSSDWTYVWIFTALFSPLTIGLCYIFILWLLPRYLFQGKWRKFFLRGILSFLITAVLVLAILLLSIGFLPGLSVAEVPQANRNFPFLLTYIFLIAIGVNFLALLKNRQIKLLDQLHLEKRLAENEALVKKQELGLLKNQLHPHFLFNTLNTLYSLALTKSENTAPAILKLSALLDYSLYEVQKATVPLENEIQYLLDYIHLEKSRIDYPEGIAFEVKSDHKTYQVAPMLLMPFVENAFKHGKITNGKLDLNIRLEVENDHLIFSVTNPSQENKIKEGLGLTNIRQRLALLYPKRHQLKIDTKSGIFGVTLQIEGLTPESSGSN